MAVVLVQSIVVALLLVQFLLHLFSHNISEKYCAHRVFCWSIGTDGSCVGLSRVSIIFESIMFESIMSSIMSSIGRRGC